MKPFLRTTAAAAALAMTAAAHADTFDFSYVFSDGVKVTGSFDGFVSGGLIQNIYDAAFAVNGTDVVVADHSYVSVGSLVTPYPYVALDGSSANFYFIDDKFNSYLQMTFPSPNAGSNDLQSRPVGQPPIGDAGVYDGTFKVTDVSTPAVPESPASAMLLAGLGLMAFAVRRLRP